MTDPRTNILAVVDLAGMQGVEQSVALIEQLKGGLASRLVASEVYKYIDSLFREVPLIGYQPTDLKIIRGRLDPADKFTRTDDFASCPAHLVKSLGRCNNAGQSVFYAASNFDTVFAELNAEPGDRIHVGIASVKVADPLKITAIGEIDHVRRFNRPLIGDQHSLQIIRDLINNDDEMSFRRVLVDAYFAEAFAENSRVSGIYKITAALANVILDHNPESPKLDAFFYPSVAHRGGMNIAITESASKSKLEWEAFRVFEIHQKMGFGIYSTSRVAESTTIAEDGVISWK